MRSNASNVPSVRRVLLRAAAGAGVLSVGTRLHAAAPPAPSAPQDFSIPVDARRKLDAGETLNFRFDAPSGQFRMHWLSPAVAAYDLEAALAIGAFHPNRQWPPTAYVGFFGSDSHDSVVRFTLGQAGQRADVLAVQVEVIVKEQSVARDVIKLVPPDAVVRFRFLYTGRKLVASVDDGDPVELSLPFDRVTPYVSASSARADASVRRKPAAGYI